MYHRKIVITTEDASGLSSPVCRKFGKSPYFVVAEVAGGEVVHTAVVANDRFSGHQMGLLHPTCRCGADVLLAGGMEPRVAEMFADMGVEVISDLNGSARDALTRYLSDNRGQLLRAAGL